ncbi:MAG: hypothetical protein HY272_01970 [Gammaproteobacteria bacterium]|nr:hypothetical protein [Gammaproteobacteria bacterium]
MPELLYIRNTNTIELAQLKNAESGALLDGAYTVRATIKSGGVNVSGDSWPVALTYAGANGRFVGRVSHQLVLTDGTEYDLIVEAFSVTDNVYGEWNDKVTAAVRGQN